MTKSNLSDLDIEILLFGKWRFNTSWEKITIFFKDDMTYEQTRIQTFIIHKPRELITGNKFTGVWYVSEGVLYCNVKTAPNSLFNIRVPLVFKVHLADAVASLSSVFEPERYEVVEINESKFLMMNKDQSIIGAKLKGNRERVAESRVV